MKTKLSWETIKSLHLNPNIQSLEDFEACVTVGVERAKSYLDAVRRREPIGASPEIISEIHRHVFSAVFPWAGDFRSPDLAQGQALDGGIPGQPQTVHWQNINPSLMTTQTASTELLGKTFGELQLEDIKRQGQDIQVTPEDRHKRALDFERKAEGMGILLHGFERTRPFTVGNDVVADVLFAGLGQQHLGGHFASNLTPDMLKQNLAEFDRTNDITPLRQQIMEASAGLAWGSGRDLEGGPTPEPGRGPDRGPGHGPGPGSPGSHGAADHSHDKDQSHEQ